jgi:hypothetical protein
MSGGPPQAGWRVGVGLGETVAATRESVASGWETSAASGVSHSRLESEIAVRDA